MGRFDLLTELVDKPTPSSVKPVTPSNPPLPETSARQVPVRPNDRPPVHPGKRIITRNSFELYEDQMDSLRDLAYLEKKQGNVGSMSAMVRDAIDDYLAQKSSNE